MKFYESVWFWRIMGAIGCLFFFAWLGFSLALLLDTTITGGSEWAPWAAEEAASRAEYIVAYAITSLLGIVGSVYMVQWIWPFLKE